MNNKGVIIQGSSQSDGNTNKIVSFIAEKSNYDVMDLNLYEIGPFDYEFKNQGDDFMPLMKRIVDTYDTIIFATPVYWYSMSGVMKIFFDRISDCLKIEKEVGRKLRGKSMGMISCGSGSEPVKGFSMPFVQTANYLSMQYVGDIHTWIEDGSIPDVLEPNLNTFASKL